MEESIRRAEKLVHATNSALAQMKYSLTFDKLNKEPLKRSQSQSALAKMKFFLNEDYENFEREFRSDANEMLSRMDKVLDPSQYSSARLPCNVASKARDRIKEINRNFKNRRPEQKPLELEQSRLKLLNLINDDSLKNSTVSNKSSSAAEKDSNPLKENTYTIKEPQKKIKHIPVPKLDFFPEKLVTKEKSKEDLKSKLLETQEIVNRGFQTVRQLSHRMENIAKNEKKLEKISISDTPGTDEILSKSLNGSRKSFSSETIKSLPSQKCERCHKLKKKKKIEKDKVVKYNNVEPVESNRNCLVSVKRQEAKRVQLMPKLNLQRLPSIHIKGGLQMQSVLSLEIPPEHVEAVTARANTAITILSHDKIEKEKLEKAVERIKKENCVCQKQEKENLKDHHIECFNCGKLIQIREIPENPKAIDDLLLQCRFNVFDPRIDEFVENFRGFSYTDEKKSGETFQSRPLSETPKKQNSSKEEMRKKVIEKPKIREVYYSNKPFRIEKFSQELTQKYKAETSQLENNYREFKSILKNLFKEVDDSRETFENYYIDSLSEKEKNSPKEKPCLSLTKPLVLCVTETLQKENKTSESIPLIADNLTGDEFHENSKAMQREKKKKLSKKDVKNKFKSRTKSMIMDKTKTGVAISATNEKNEKRPIKKKPLKIENKHETFSKLPMPADMILNEIFDSKEDDNKKSITGEDKAIVNEREIIEMNPSSLEGSKGEKQKNTGVSDNDDMKTENDYESDFEGESLIDEESINVNKENSLTEEHDFYLAKSCNKLSTISEVDSELEKKISEDEKSKAQSSQGNNENEGKEAEINYELDDFLTESLEKDHDSEDLLFKSEKNGLGRIKGSRLSPLLVSPLSSIATSDSLKKALKNLEENKALSAANKNNGILIKSSSGSVVSQKSCHSETVSSLQEVLAALKSQFSRTQILADKLTENVKNLRNESENAKIKNQRNITETLISPNRLTKMTESIGNDLSFSISKDEEENDCLHLLEKKSQFTLFPRSKDHKSDRERKAKIIDHSTISSSISLDKKADLDENLDIAKVPSECNETSFDDIDLDYFSDQFQKKDKTLSNSRSVSHSDNTDVRKMNRLKLSVTSENDNQNGEPEKSLSHLPLDFKINNVSLSEDEILSNIDNEAEGSTIPSIGEVISENISEEINSQ